jgi:lipoprotein-anchoring transpeptidase ErfK/SrfK
VSPGVDGMNPRAHATARGHHYIDWKMLTADMDGNDKGKYWFVDEVPWVAYYYENFALHGAWWHDNFGRPMSHGCVNIAPADAHKLFNWMDPVIPPGWYAASAHYPYSKGTMVYIRQ